MKVAIMTRLFAEWYVDVDACHFNIQYSVAVYKCYNKRAY